MALNGSFVLNGADYAPLTFPGIGTFMAFSGNGANRNRAGCSHIPTIGPLPPGKYWIVDRLQGGFYARSVSGTKDLYNKVFHDAQFGHADWFALWRDDLGIDDWTWFNGIKRGNFRLHPGTVEGCITLYRSSDFEVLRNSLLSTSLIDVPCMKNLKARGFIEVQRHVYGDTCPTRS